MLLLALSVDSGIYDFDGSLASVYSSGFQTAGTGVRGNRLVSSSAWSIYPKKRNALTAVDNSIVFGFAMRFNTTPSAAFFRAIDSTATNAFSLTNDGTGKVVLRNGNDSVLATSSLSPLTIYAFNYVEVKFVYANSTSTTITIKVDGVTVISGTYSITLAANTIAGFSGGDSYGAQSEMDFYCLDSSGANNNDFLGDCRVEHLVATAEGSNTGWTSNTSDKVNDVNTPAGADGNYIRTTTSNNRQTFVITDPGNTTGTIKGVQILSRAHGENNGIQKVAGVVRVAGTSYNASDYGLASNSAGDYSPCVSTFEKSPATSADWTMAELAALEAGVVVLP